MGSTSFSRRTALRAAMIAALGAGTARTAGSAGADPITIPLPPFPGGLGPIPQPPSNSPLVTSSPPLRPYVDDLWVPPAHRSGAELTARAVRHRYHADLPPTRAFGYGDHILGPTITAHSGEELALSFGNRLGEHPLAEYVDESMMATTGADRTDPRTTVHLHGAPTAPASDGFPTICWRRNGMQHNRYGNRQEAATLWYHDHAVGITRLNVQAGLAGVYLVRDAHDTGEADNPLGLPAGERELPLVLQDRTFKTDGSLEARQFNFLPHDMNQAGQLGDVAVVNGVAWPRHRVARGLYRLRVVLGANGRVFRLQFSNSMRFWVIGGDQGLLDAPQAVRSITMSPGERADLLVDFGSADGGAVDLMNTAENSIGNALFVVPTLRRIMRFHLSGPRERARVPETLRGGPRRPPRLPAPVRSLVENLSTSGAAQARVAERGNLSQDLRPVTEFCQRAIAGRYPFVESSSRDVLPEDFGQMFGPGGMMDDFFQKRLAQLVDTSRRPWRYKPVAEQGAISTSALQQFERADLIKQVFFRGGGRGPAMRLDFKPVELDAGITQFTLDVDGQLVKYAHGPIVPMTVQWPGPRNTNQVRINVQPPTAGGTSGQMTEGPWALFKMLDRGQLASGDGPEKFLITFQLDARRAKFEVTTNSVQHPIRLKELREFSCPEGL